MPKEDAVYFFFFIGAVEEEEKTLADYKRLSAAALHALDTHTRPLSRNYA
jgi:hypothetical protein